jgi:hypothetical protein
MRALWDKIRAKRESELRASGNEQFQLQNHLVWIGRSAQARPAAPGIIEPVQAPEKLYIRGERCHLVLREGRQPVTRTDGAGAVPAGGVRHS